MPDQEVRWELGEAVLNNNKAVPGGFIFVYAAVIGWKHLARAVRRGHGWVRRRVGPGLYRLTARGRAANSNRPGEG